MTRSLVPLCLVGVAWMGLVVGMPAVPGDEQPIGASRIMRLKLNHSQKLLQGLVQADYETVAKQSQQLVLLSIDASWQVLQTPEYTQQSLQFRRSAEALKEAAQAENLDAATLAYIDLTMRCVECHKYVRDVRPPVTHPAK